MANLVQFHDPHISLFQSAIDEVLAKAAAVVARPDPGHTMVQAAAVEGHAAKASSQPAPAPIGGGIGGQMAYCASLARQYGLAVLECRTADATHYHELLTEKMGLCDPAWVDTAVKYGEFLLSRKKIPYRVYRNIGDFVIDGKLPANARVAFVGDWGTGQDASKTLLEQIARKNPDVVIHMGDVYYSGTDFEMQNYFYNIWNSTLDLSKTATFTLTGNHDMFSGGEPYYKLIGQLGQPASYFCLRNDAWQFIAMDTGLHDSVPGGTAPTYLEDTEVAWVADKIRNGGGRRTVLLSHHQLFTANQDIGGQAVNDRLNAQLSPLLPDVDLWLWGHEHNLVIYQEYMGVRARCIGHGAFPMALGEIPATPLHPEVPLVPVRLGDDGAFYRHGYVIMDLDGVSATLSYYQDSDETNPLFTETLA